MQRLQHIDSMVEEMTEDTGVRTTGQATWGIMWHSDGMPFMVFDHSTSRSSDIRLLLSDQAVAL